MTVLLNMAADEVEDFLYRGEGNSSLVVFNWKERYVLRIPKKLKHGHEEPSSQNITFTQHIVKPKLGDQYVPHMEIVKLSPEFLRALQEKVESSRPANRSHQELAVHCGAGVRCRDVCFLPSPSSVDIEKGHTLPTFCVEIKPKFGAIVDGSSVCQFCMHQHLKLKQGKWKSLSQYCPIDLFSGDICRMCDAILGLFTTPQNNFRLFQDGQLIYSEEWQQDFLSVLEPYFSSAPLCYNCSKVEKTSDRIDANGHSRDMPKLHCDNIEKNQNSISNIVKIATSKKFEDGNKVTSNLCNSQNVKRRMVSDMLCSNCQDPSAKISARSCDAKSGIQIQSNTNVEMDKIENGRVGDSNPRKRRGGSRFDKPPAKQVIPDSVENQTSSFGANGLKSTIAENFAQFIARCLLMPSEDSEDGSTNDDLPESCVLQRILKLQKQDMCGVLGLLQYYERVKKAVNDHSYGKDISEAFENLLAAQDALSSDDDDKEIIQMKHDVKQVADFLEAHTAKDCSIMIAFQPKPANHQKSSDSHTLYHGRRYFDFRCSVVDLDRKELHRIDKYLKWDKEMKESYKNCQDT